MMRRRRMTTLRPVGHYRTTSPRPLGEIIVSVPQAERQAQSQGVPLRRELALLIVHGALHLLGHDHYGDDEREAMQALERAALAGISGINQ